MYWRGICALDRLPTHHCILMFPYLSLRVLTGGAEFRAEFGVLLVGCWGGEFKMYSPQAGILFWLLLISYWYQCSGCGHYAELGGGSWSLSGVGTGFKVGAWNMVYGYLSPLYLTSNLSIGRLSTCLSICLSIYIICIYIWLYTYRYIHAYIRAGH